MKARGLGVKDIIMSGNVPFLASAFATPSDLMAIQENEDAISASLKQLTGSKTINLQDIANLGSDLIADAFGSTVAHGKDLAQRLIIEAQFWMRFLGGSVPAPGPIQTAPVPGQQPTEEKAEPVQEGEQWGKPTEEVKEEEAKPLASQESWFEPGQKSEEEGAGEQSEAEDHPVAEATVRDDKQQP